jgi:hypothetical protein
MKNIISEKEFTSQKKNKYDQSSVAEQKQNKKSPSKLIKGKVKVYNSSAKLIDSEYLDDESELNLISERMLIFLKFTFLFIILIALLILFKRIA